MVTLIRFEQYAYPFRVVWNGEDDEFVATCASFPGLSALGSTVAEAIDEATVALKLFIDTYKADGRPLPEPPSAGEVGK